MRHMLMLLAAVVVAPAGAEPLFPAVLAGQAILPAAAVVVPPDAAPPGFRLAGRWANAEGRRAEAVGAAPGFSGAGETARPTGLALPLAGQPAGAIGGIAAAAGGGYWAVGDAGFGGRAAGADVLLRLGRVRPDFAGGTVVVEPPLFLSDPARAVPFHIVTDASTARYLTGADFDPAGIVAMPDGGFWVADRAGPTLLRFDAAGRLRDGFEPRRADGVAMLAADRPGLAPPAAPGSDVVQPAGGFAGMALTPDGRSLWAAFGRPLRDASAAGVEEGVVRLLEFDPAARDWTGRAVAIELAGTASAIGGLVFVDDRRALLIERDAGEGDAGLRCGGGRRPPGCFGTPAVHRRLVLADLGAVDGEGFARRLGAVDLLDIADPRGLARQRGDRAGSVAGRFGLPFAALGGLALAGDGRVVVVNANAPGRAAGRHLAQADDTEFVLLDVAELLAAR